MKDILVIDDSKKRRELFRAARYWAEITGASIKIFSVIDESAVRDTTRAIGVIGKVAKAVKNDLIEEARSNICSELEDAGIACEDIEVKIGIPLNEIKDVLSKVIPDLIIMGTGIKSGVINITGEIIGYSKGNCFVVTQHINDLKFKKLILATDDYERNRYVIETSLTLAERFKGLLYVLTVVDLNEVVQIHAPDFVENAYTKARNHVERIVNTAKMRGLQCEGMVREGSISDVLTQVFHEIKPDLTILGSESRTGLNRILMGSVSNSLIKKINSPLLIIKKSLIL